MALNLLSMFKKATPAEREELAREVVDVDALAARVHDQVRAELAATTPAAPASEGVHVLGDEERRVIGEEERRARAAYTARVEDRDQRIKLAEEKRAATLQECEAAYALDTGHHEFSIGSVARQEQLWAGRLPLVDALIAKCKTEDAALWPPATFTIPEDRVSMGSNVGIMVPQGEERRIPDRDRRVVSNGATVYARQLGLRHLAERLPSWTRRGEYSTAAELMALFEEAYQALPAVEPIEAVMRRDPRARRFVRDGAAPPPAA